MSGALEAGLLAMLGAWPHSTAADDPTRAHLPLSFARVLLADAPVGEYWSTARSAPEADRDRTQVPATHRAGAPDPSETTSTAKVNSPSPVRGFLSPATGSVAPADRSNRIRTVVRGASDRSGSPSPMRVSSSSTGPSPARSRTASATACRNTAGGTGDSPRTDTPVSRSATPSRDSRT
ncbi:hypothetical protein ACFY3M_23660 [Streptomyces mirabilis]|uniref:hypothetical protein n=1 Tax=Streptomyces mirabilis TaxID=68239 RepID=UPI003682B710